ncbi:hypothetical protein JZU56_05895, partial [bacterium]|nr:hypothetical protein [bacterium]
MGNVAVLGIADIAVVRFLAVFLELSIRADLDWIESANLIADRFEEGLCFAQQVGQDLAQPVRVAADRHRDVVGDVEV